MNKTMVICSIERFPNHNSEDRLEFQPGVNVIVGPPNSGKTKWLQFIDYLLGDDKNPEEALGKDIYDKYESAKMVIDLGGTEHIIERRWKEAGSRTKVIVDDKLMSSQDAGHFFMESLGIPILHYPQGNPYGPRTWPELSWRSLLRHVYRRQGFWSDFADRQPESEQHACLLQFVGLAEHLFSNKYGDLVSKEKKISELTIAKDQFMQNLQEISSDLLEEKSMSVGLTPESIKKVMCQIQAQIDEMQKKRQNVLRELANKTSVGSQNDRPVMFDQLSKKLVDLNSQQEKSKTLLQNTLDRLAEIEKYRDLIVSELERLNRTKVASKVLSELKVTHCPACDQEIQKKSSEQNVCYVCGQMTPLVKTEDNKRLEFEVEQLEGEIKETEQLTASLQQEVDQLKFQNAQIAKELERINRLLQPVQTAAAQILPPEISILDMETGRFEERLQQLRRVEKSLNRRDKLNEQIQKIQNDITQLEVQVTEQHSQLNFEKASDDFADGMNSYLNTIRESNPSSWTLGSPVAFHMGKSGFKATIAREKWSAKLGGTLTLYFIIAYHYALMSLVSKPGYHYPGLLILDFPPELEDGSSVADKENFVLEPFLKLQESLKPTKTQVIAMGSSFKDLPAASRIEFKKVWGE